MIETKSIVVLITGADGDKPCGVILRAVKKTTDAAPITACQGTKSGPIPYTAFGNQLK